MRKQGPGKNSNRHQGDMTTGSLFDMKESSRLSGAVANLPKLLFSKKWILSTILSVIGVLVLVRLGIWQLDRLDNRRAFNARVLSGMNAPMLVIDQDAFDLELYNMEYREVQVTGQYDFDQEIALRNQHWENQWEVTSEKEKEP